MSSHSSHVELDLVHRLTVAFQGATEARLAVVTDAVSEGTVEQLADEGIAILNEVDHRKVFAALDSTRKFVTRQSASISQI